MGFRPKQSLKFAARYCFLWCNSISLNRHTSTRIDSEKPGLSHRLPFEYLNSLQPLRLLLALAWFNSLPVDWIARFMIQIHANKTYLFRLPVPQPSDTEILTNTDYTTLAKNALLLSLAASWDDFAELAPLFNVQKHDVPATAKAMDTLRAENDKIVARLYGIDNREFAHLLKSFKGMATKRPEYLALLHAN